MTDSSPLSSFVLAAYGISDGSFSHFRELLSFPGFLALYIRRYVLSHSVSIHVIKLLLNFLLTCLVLI